jgi:threonine synthase
VENGVTNKIPKIVAVQAENCAPLANAFITDQEVAEVKNTGTLAEGIAIAKPARSAQILEAVRTTNGHFITTSEEEIIQTRVNSLIKVLCRTNNRCQPCWLFKI